MKKLILFLGLISLNVVASDKNNFIEMLAAYVQQRDGVRSLHHTWISVGYPQGLISSQSASAQTARELQEQYYKEVASENRKKALSETVTE